MRDDLILARVEDREYLTVTEAASLVRVSPATIRRYFNRLAEHGLVERTRGGLRRNGGRPRHGRIPPFSQREVRLAREKEAIAREAAGLLSPNDVVIVSGGTTTYHLAALLPEFPIRIVTNSVRLASAASDRPGTAAEIYLVGGFLYPQAGLLLGPEARASFGRYNARWAFLSVGGVDSRGLTNTNELVAETQRAMIDHAESLVVLVDHTKIGHTDMSFVCDWDRVDILITDDASSLDRLCIADRDVRVLRVDVV